jgi:kinesin family protein 15
LVANEQTGSGKTFTTFGPAAFLQSENDLSDAEIHSLRGLVPRVLDYLFRSIAKMEEDAGGRLKFTCKCSFYEIFNEKVFDLLDLASSGQLQVRSDNKRGVYVEGLIEEPVSSPEEARAILVRGYRARHVGETAM